MLILYSYRGSSTCHTVLVTVPEFLCCTRRLTMFTTLFTTSWCFSCWITIGLRCIVLGSCATGCFMLLEHSVTMRFVGYRLVSFPQSPDPVVLYCCASVIKLHLKLPFWFSRYSTRLAFNPTHYNVAPSLRSLILV